MSVDLICIDADDTLWHNMRHFEATEAALLALLQPFVQANVAREMLYTTEARNLQLYGYGAKGFTLSMIETALELGGEQLPAKVVAGILQAGRALLAHPVELFADIGTTLEALARRGRLVLVTKGDLLHQETKLAASGLGDYFSGVEIVSEKSAQTYRSLFARYNVPPHRAVMAGDSMRSDILPALEAGAWAAFVPHTVVWHLERADAPGQHQRFRQLASLAELPGWIDTLPSV
jgi:putative hydrolase of the HAD superfamily